MGKYKFLDTLLGRGAKTAEAELGETLAAKVAKNAAGAVHIPTGAADNIIASALPETGLEVMGRVARPAEAAELSSGIKFTDHRRVNTDGTILDHRGDRMGDATPATKAAAPNNTAPNTVPNLEPAAVAKAVSEVKKGLKLNDSDGIDIGHYVTSKHKKILRDAAKREKDIPGTLAKAQESVAMQVGDAINRDAKAIANAKGYVWEDISQAFGVRNSLFKYTSAGTDPRTGLVFSSPTRDVDPELISRVFTEATKTDFVHARMAVNVAIPPLAPLVGTSGRLFSERLNPARREFWKNLGWSAAAALGFGVAGGELREYADAKQADEKGKTAERFDFSFQRGLDRGIPFVHSGQTPDGVAETATEVFEPFLSKKIPFTDKEAPIPLPFLGDVSPLGALDNAYRAYVKPKAKAEASTPAQPQAGSVDWSAPPSPQTNGTGVAPTNIDWNAPPTPTNGQAKGRQ